MAEENAAKLRPVATELPGHLVKIQCITDLRPWANVHVNHNGSWVSRDQKNPNHAEPLLIDQVAVIPKDAAYQKMVRNRHIVRFAAED